MNYELQEYIDKMRQEGKSDEEIKKELFGAGWTEDQLNDLELSDKNNNKQKNIELSKIKYSGRVLMKIGSILLYLPVGLIGISLIVYGFSIIFSYFIGIYTSSNSLTIIGIGMVIGGLLLVIYCEKKIKNVIIKKENNNDQERHLVKRIIINSIIDLFVLGSGYFLMFLALTEGQDMGSIVPAIAGYILAFVGFISLIKTINFNSKVTKVLGIICLVFLGFMIINFIFLQNIEPSLTDALNGYSIVMVHMIIIMGWSYIIRFIKKIPSYSLKGYRDIKKDDYVKAKKFGKTFYKKWWFIVILIILFLSAVWSILVMMNDNKFNMDNGPKNCSGLLCSLDSFIFKWKCGDRGGDYFSPQDNYNGKATCGFDKFEFVRDKYKPPLKYCKSSEDCTGLCVYYDESPDINKFECQLYRIGGPAYFTTIENYLN